MHVIIHNTESVHIQVRPSDKVKFGVLHPVQQPRSYWDMSTSLSVCGSRLLSQVKSPLQMLRYMLLSQVKSPLQMLRYMLQTTYIIPPINTSNVMLSILENEYLCEAHSPRNTEDQS